MSIRCKNSYLKVPTIYSILNLSLKKALTVIKLLTKFSGYLLLFRLLTLAPTTSKAKLYAFTSAGQGLRV